MLKQLLQGRPFGHPLHPLLVHLPIALFYLSFIVDIWYFIGQTEVLARSSFYLLVFGVIGALLAAVPGIADYSDIRRDSDARQIARRHMLLNIAAVVVYLLSVLLRADQPTIGLLPFTLSVMGVALISYSGYLGGILVYDEGVAVGRHRRRTPLPYETLRRTSDAAGDGFVEVADASALPDGHTLRAEIDGFVVCIANVGGELHAFQEFCTHRFGPLSEGCLKDGKVECPWHRSAFEVKTGKVADGPAKVDLKVFEVTLRDGKVFARAR